MKRKQKTALFSLILVIIILLSGLNILGAAPKVNDKAALFTKSQLEGLEKRAVVLSEKLKTDIVILTISDNQGKAAGDYADDFYGQNGFGFGENADGILLLLDMDDLVVSIAAYGTTREYFDNALYQSIFDEMDMKLENGGTYCDAATIFLNKVDHYVGEGLSANQHTKPEQSNAASAEETGSKARIPWKLLISLAVGAITVGLMVIGSIDSSTIDENTYLKNNELKIINKQDRHFNTEVTFEEIKSSSSSSESDSQSQEINVIISISSEEE